MRLEEKVRNVLYEMNKNKEVIKTPRSRLIFKGNEVVKYKSPSMKWNNQKQVELLAPNRKSGPHIKLFERVIIGLIIHKINNNLISLRIKDTNRHPYSLIETLFPDLPNKAPDFDYIAVSEEIMERLDNRPKKERNLSSAAEELDRKVDELYDRSLEDLLNQWKKKKKSGKKSRKKGETTKRKEQAERDSLVVAIALKRADGSCEACKVSNSKYKLFKKNNGHPYLEVHHILPLGTGGEDTPENAVCVCPSHHRELHFGYNSEKLAEKLIKYRVDNP